MILLLCSVIVGCTAGSGEGLDISGRPLSEGGDVPLAPTLASIQANVFNPSCIVCHAGANAPQGLRLDVANSFTNLVGVASRQDSSFLRVMPGNPDLSYVIQKLEGKASVGEQMPLGGPPVPQATINFVRQWITDGALPDSGGPPNVPPVVVSLIPDPDSVVGSFPSDITAGFDQDIDASTINDMTFTLIRSGGDGTFGDGNEEVITPASVALSGMNPRLAVMDLTGVSTIEDRYQITLHGSGPNIILGINGVALDGQYPGSFPSGDGTEGGDFVVEFEVQGIQPSLASIQNNIFTPTCSVAGCHSGPPGPNLPAGMDLSSANASFSSLVNILSIEVPTILRIAVHDADNSYLIHKLEGTSADNSRMPLGGPFLDQATIDVIRRWIDTGAPL
ncbi:MAG: hypothetical protein IIA78_02350 [Proteobacteria bacterium]|nr:hypothetical protein [Pseudomonadota bacterium]